MTVDRVSIIIPTYNHAQYIGEAIESALAQTCPAHEILVIDNDSTDNTLDIVTRYREVRYIHQTNQDICGSSNRGLHEASGEYVVFLHGDDHLLPHHLKTSLDAFQKRPSAAFVSGHYRWFGAERTWHNHACDSSPDDYAGLLRVNYIGPPIVVMFRRNVLLAVGGFHPRFAYTGATEIYLRIARQYPIHCHHTVVAEYRRHDGQHSQKGDLHFESIMATMRSQKPFIKGNRSYEEAYRVGVRHYQRAFGDPLGWHMVCAARNRHWKVALKTFRVLLRCYPQGLLSWIHQKRRPGA